MQFLHRFDRRLAIFLRCDHGVIALEYAILVGVVAVAITAGLAVFSNELTDAMSTISTSIPATLKKVGN